MGSGVPARETAGWRVLTVSTPEIYRVICRRSFQAHAHVRIGNTVEGLAELTRLVLVGDELTIRNLKLCVVRWDDARLPNFFGPLLPSRATVTNARRSLRFRFGTRTPSSNPYKRYKV